MIVQVVDALPSSLPSVTKWELERAWAAAQSGLRQAEKVQGFRFAPPQGPAVELLLTGPDAAAWAGAVAAVAPLASRRGVSVCLRLLALVALMAAAVWARPWFVRGRGITAPASPLLQAAALCTLLDSGGFDETALRALLPEPAARGWTKI